MFKVGDEIDCVITEIDKDKRRVAISHRLTKENLLKYLKKIPSWNNSKWNSGK